MNPKNILLVGVKGAALAFRRDTGEHLWATELKSSSNDFVTVIGDDTRAYAHTGGELFCLDLLTGNQLWHDKLKGFGYGLATLAFPGGTAVSPTAAEVIRQAAATAAANAHVTPVGSAGH
jgi:outer membrane protein assembly factor BamB